MKAYHSREELIQEQVAIQEETTKELKKLKIEDAKEKRRKFLFLLLLLILSALLWNLLCGTFVIPTLSYKLGYQITLNGENINYHLQEKRKVVLMPFQWTIHKKFNSDVIFIENKTTFTFQNPAQITLQMIGFHCTENKIQKECQKNQLKQEKVIEALDLKTYTMTITKKKQQLYQGPLLDDLLPKLDGNGTYKIVLEQKDSLFMSIVTF